MANLYLTEQGATLRKRGDRLLVEKRGEELLEIRCFELEAVLIFGNVQFTTQAVAELLEHGIELALFSRNGRLRGQLTPPKAKNLPLRLRQYQLVDDEAFALTMGRELVAAKIESSAAVLRRYRANHPDALRAAEVRALQAKAERAPKAEALDVLRGIEGSAAAHYFRCLAQILPRELCFQGRVRRPPTDPFNALLSLGYTLAGNEIQSLLDGIGYDPFLGFLHRQDYGRASLALDLLEEFRAPLVDRFSLSMVNRQILRPGDFEDHPSGGCYLNRDGRKTYFRSWEAYLEEPFAGDDGPTTFRKLFRRQAERLARALLQQEPYESFRLPC